MIYFEDLVVGTVSKSGAKLVTREEVIDFATQYDPQPFHLDDEAAAQTYFGRLSASGWHTAAMTMRLMVDHWKEHQVASLGSPGIDELRWIKPVYPGDTIHVEQHMLEKRQSASRPEMGITKTRWSVYNQHGELVMTMIALGLVEVREPAAQG